MSNKFKKIIPIIILITIITSLGVFVFETKTADANALTNFAAKIFGSPITMLKDAIIGMVSNFTYYVILRPFSLLLSISAFLLDWAFGLEKFTDVNVVQEGWKITRGLANMFFILILMIIAFATILRVETYGMKTLLPKLIIAALLINFSLVFCGAIIDSTQIMSHFFLDPLKGDGQGESLSARVAEGLNIVKIFDTNGEIKIGDAVLAPLDILIGIIFGVVFIIVAAIVLAAAAFFLIVRVVALWILIVLAPIAWLLWILPATRSLWNQWWGSFLKWAFFAPIYGFFFYLAIITVIGKEGETDGFLEKMASDIKLGKNEGFVDGLFSSQELILQYIFLIILLFAGLIIAQKVGVLGASGVINITKSAGKGVSSWAGRKAQRAAYRPVDKMSQGLDKVSTWARKSRVGRWTGASTLLGKTAGAGRALNERERAAFTKEEEKYKNQTSEHLKQQYKSVDGRGKAAIAKLLAGRGDLKVDEKLGFTEKDIEKSTVLAKRYEQQKDILAARPDLARFVKEKDQTDKEAISIAFSKITPANAEKLQADTFEQKDPEVHKAVMEAVENQITKRATTENPNNGKWKSNVLSKMGENNPKVSVIIQQKIIKNQMEDTNKWKQFEQERPDMAGYVKSDPGKAIYGDSIPDIKTKNPELYKELTEKKEVTKKEDTNEEWKKKNPL